MNNMELPPTEVDAFQAAVWKIVRQIPAGKVCSYGQIAGYILRPAMVSQADYEAYRARWVGNAMAASPQGVPWQRVVNAQGKISIRRGAETQRKLLESEGVVFDARDRIDMKRFGWEGPSTEWLRENGYAAPEDPQQPRLI